MVMTHAVHWLIKHSLNGRCNKWVCLASEGIANLAVRSYLVLQALLRIKFTSTLGMTKVN